MVDWLRPHFNEENEPVDLFHAITSCQGWIKSNKTDVTVRREPLRQNSRRIVQEQLCRKLTNLGARTPTGKWLVVAVGEEPTKNVPKKVGSLPPFTRSVIIIFIMCLIVESEYRCKTFLMLP